MKIIYSPHAQKRLWERKISKDAVFLTIQSPDQQTLADRGRMIVRKNLGNRILEVIYVIENNKIIVITLYYL